MSRNEEAIAVFVDNVDDLIAGIEVPLAKAPVGKRPVATVSGRVILLEQRDLKPKGGVAYVVGIAESFTKRGGAFVIGGASRVVIPIVVGLGAKGENVRPDLFPDRFWGPSWFVYLSADAVTRVEAEIARLVVHHGANAKAGRK